ncbi:MAG: type IV pilin protein [Chitinivibrionales bacterium]
MKRTKNQKGFTLIELMVVIVIIGILSAVAIPKFMGASAKAKMSEVPPVIAAFEHAQLAYVAETGNAGTVSQIVFDNPTNSKWFTYSDSSTAGQLTATSNNPIGDFDGTVTTAIDSALANFIHSSSDSADAAKLIPNFF